MHAPTRNIEITARNGNPPSPPSFEIFPCEEKHERQRTHRRVTDEVPAAHPRMENDLGPRTPHRSSSEILGFGRR